MSEAGKIFALSARKDCFSKASQSFLRGLPRSRKENPDVTLVENYLLI